jgi:AraC-like DNA-binding protein
LPVFKPQSIEWEVSSESTPDAFDRYRADMADYYEVSNVQRAPNQPFRNRSRATRFSAGVMGRGQCAGQTLSRTARRARHSGIDGLSIIVNHGAMVGDCDGRDIRTASGAVHFRDLTRPSAAQLETIDLVNLVISRDMVPRWFLSADMHGQVLAGDSPFGRLLGSHLTVLSEVAPSLSDEDGEAAIQAAILIAERAFGSETAMSGNQRASVYRTIRQTAARIIEKRLLDPGLTTDVIARAAAVSRTSLYRAFEDQGGVNRFVQARRLERAREALLAPRNGRVSIDRIAQSHGFPVTRTFEHLFMERFGHRPDEVGPIAADAVGSISARHDQILNWLRDL